MLMLPAIEASADSGRGIRCGGDLVSPGYLKYEVRQACGPPLSQDVVGEVIVNDDARFYAERYRRKTGASKKVILYVEEWLYDRNGLHLLRFEGNRLVQVESVRPK